jgi:hypothetical protein
VVRAAAILWGADTGPEKLRELQGKWRYLSHQLI